MRTKPICYFLVMAPLLLPAPLTAQEVLTAQWGRHEIAFRGKGARPDTELAVEFTSPSGKRRSVDGFWDGGETWRVRFMPDEKGMWEYRTRSKPAVAGLDGESGVFGCVAAKTTNPLLRHGAVRVAKSGTHLEHADGTPFFWLGDTVWTGPAFSTMQDWQAYLKDRLDKRFSVVQFNAVCPWRTAAADRDGMTAFTGRKGIAINPKYFQRLDAHMDAINERGMVAAPVLVWALTKHDPGIWLAEEDIVKLVRYQVARYGAHHVVWILAGDNPYSKESAERWKRVGRAVFGEESHAPVTTHPTGMNWPWEAWRDEKWLDILGYQSGHGDDARTLRWIHSGPAAQAWRKGAPKPIVNLEPPYEDHLGYQSRKPHSAYNVRRAVYWSLLSTPAAGVTYGGHGLWSWQSVAGKTPPDHPGTGVAKTWREALDLPGAAQMKHMAELFTSLPWWRLRPAQDLLAKQPGGDDPARHVAAARTEKGDAAVVYLPAGGEVALDVKGLARGFRAEWFDPRTGRRTPARAIGPGQFAAPDQQDWVLVLRSEKEGG
jgi:hypothetical protein